MQRNPFFDGTYLEHLRTIKGITFTRREIDILACIIGLRGAKKIASLLSISPKTAEIHIHNIMVKLNCNAREHVIDFIEKAQKTSFLRKHYETLFFQEKFEQYLKDISVIVGNKKAICRIVHGIKQNDIVYFISQLEKHLKLSGINVVLARKEQPIFVSDCSTDIEHVDHILYIFSKRFIEHFQHNNKVIEISNLLRNETKKPSSITFMSFGKYNAKIISEDFRDFTCIDVRDNYYFSVLNIIKRIYPFINLDHKISEFEKHFENTQDPSITSSKEGVELKDASFKGNLYYYNFGGILKKGALWVFIANVFVLCFVCIWVLTSSRNLNNDSKETIRSDLLLPAKSSLLERPKLLKEIGRKLKGQAGIKVIALIGPGGSGKTTLVRQFVRDQKNPIIWEMNAENKESLINSFESLTYALAKTDKEKKILIGLREVKDLKERMDKIIFYLKQSLNNHPDWILIFDNIEEFQVIQTIFPKDPLIWGRGQIILTTRDSHLQNNQYIDEVIYVGELTSAEKSQLFMQIVSPNTNFYNSHQKRSIQQFLNYLPSFPLDVSLAAHYLKAVDTTYEKYLDHLKKNTQEFTAVQESILKEVSEYTKTRYSIVTLSIKKIIEEQKESSGLLLFISLLNSQNIPRELLEVYKSDIIIDKFVYLLKKYSLITTENTSINPTDVPTNISIHRSTQEIILAYLRPLLDVERNGLIFSSITASLETYIKNVIDKEDFTKMNTIVRHSKAFLGHKNLLTNDNKGKIEAQLGIIYYYLCDYKRARHLLELSLTNLDKYSFGNQKRIADVLLYLGNVYWENGNYEKARLLLTQAIANHKNNSSKKSIELAQCLASLVLVYRELGDYEKAYVLLNQSLIIQKNNSLAKQNVMALTLTFLGSIYRHLGLYEKAKNSTDEALQLYKKLYGENHARTGWVLVYLGTIYYSLGDYEKAKKAFEKSLNIYKEYFTEDHVGVAWILAYLGNVHLALNDYEKAKNFLDQSLTIYKKHLPQNNIKIARPLRFLGNVYREIGNYKKAQETLEQSFLIHKQNYGSEHIETARVLNDLGKIYYLQGKFEKGEEYIQQALKIFQLAKDPEAYIFLENLAELYLKKATLLKEGNNKEGSKYSKKQASLYLKQAYKIIRAHFPKDSPHLIRIKLKFKDILN